MDQDSISALIKQAEIFRDSGHTAEARELYNRVLAVLPNEEFSTLGLGVCARREGDHLTALEFHRRAHEDHPHSYWPHVEAAEDYFALGRWTEAEAEWNAVLALKPDEINALRGMVRLARMRDDKAAALLALTSLPDQTEEIMLERAQLLSALERRDEALSLLRTGAEQFLQNPEFLIEIAALVRQAGNLAGAQAALEAAIPRDPRNPKALLKLSDLARQTHNHTLALYYLTQAKQNCAKDIWVDLCLAQTLFELGLYMECDTALAEAQTAYGGHFLVAQVRGELLAKRGRLDEAQAVLADAMHAYPSDESLALMAAELAHRTGQAARAAQLAAAIAPVRDPGHKMRWLLLQAAIAEEFLATGGRGSAVPPARGLAARQPAGTGRADPSCAALRRPRTEPRKAAGIQPAGNAGPAGAWALGQCFAKLLGAISRGTYVRAQGDGADQGADTRARGTKAGALDGAGAAAARLDTSLLRRAAGAPRGRPARPQRY